MPETRRVYVIKWQKTSAGRYAKTCMFLNREHAIRSLNKWILDYNIADAKLVTERWTSESVREYFSS